MTDLKLKIRTATPTDFPAIAGLLNAVWPDQPVSVQGLYAFRPIPVQSEATRLYVHLPERVFLPAPYGQINPQTARV